MTSRCAVRLRRRRGRLGRGVLAHLEVIRLHKLTALRLALGLVVVVAAALIVRFVAIATAAARGGLGRGGPHRLAVHVLVHRLERTALVAIVVLEHQTLAL